MIPWIDRSLWHWAKYARADFQPLGYGRNPLVRIIMIEGHGQDEMPDHLLVLDQAIARLSEDLRRVVRVRYLHDNLYQTGQQKARALGLSIDAYKRRVNKLHATLDAELNQSLDKSAPSLLLK